MIIIADSGSTKTHWKLIGMDGAQSEIFSEGINPYFLKLSEITSLLRHTLEDAIHGKIVHQVFFYGAGCGAETNKDFIRKAFAEVLPESEVEVQTDLLGAARGACGAAPGIAAILGTGSNSCDFDGENIVENMPSLGFILGDEGSGAYIGKTFLQAYLNRELPDHLKGAFLEHFGIGSQEIIRAVYKEPHPNRYLASFVKFLGQYKEDSYVCNLVASCFHLFFDKHICKYKSYQDKPLSCVGSVGYYFEDILSKVCKDRQVVLQTVLERPMDGIVTYHLKQAGKYEQPT